MKSMTSPASPGSRILSPIAAWSNVPNPRQANASVPQGPQIGNAPLTWAFSEAAVLFLRDHPAAQQYLARLEKKQDTGKAVTILAQKLARAVYYRLKRKVAFDTEMFLHETIREGSG